MPHSIIMAHRPMESHSAMCAPPLLALAVSADAVFTLTLTLLSCEGPMWDALLPSTPNLRLRFAAGLGDLLALMLLRDLSAMLPLLEGGLALSRAGAAIIALVNAGVIAALAVKAGLALQMSAPAHKTLDLPEAGVQVRVRRGAGVAGGSDWRHSQGCCWLQPITQPM